MLLESKKNRFFVISLVLLILLVLPGLSRADNSSPMEVIRSGTAKVLTILRASEKGQAPPLRQRERQILKVVTNYFDFDAMAKESLGPPWKRLSAGKRHEFAQLFKKLLFNTYVDRMEHYHDQPITYDSQQVDGDFAVVKTHFRSQDENVPIDYRLHRQGGHWKVYDVVVDGISYDDNYRAQFASILASQSFDTLLGMLRQKVARPSRAAAGNS